jgi:hypothetical protein
LQSPSQEISQEPKEAAERFPEVHTSKGEVGRRMQETYSLGKRVHELCKNFSFSHKRQNIHKTRDFLPHCLLEKLREDESRKRIFTVTVAYEKDTLLHSQVL